MADCFIIMPITTPKLKLPDYSNDEEHFKHVLECLFIPAIEKADLKPIPPISKGSDVIHADIISNIEKSDLVLCDMSCLNPNVFFELGIRTALNKPVSMIKDDVTSDVPFDTSIVNFHTYQSVLQPWTLEEEIEKLTKHINDCLEKNKDSNSLWKIFGLTIPAPPHKGEKNLDDRLDLLTLEIRSLKKQLKAEEHNKFSESKVESLVDAVARNEIDNYLHNECEDITNFTLHFKANPNRVYINQAVIDFKNLSVRQKEKIKETVKGFGYKATFSQMAIFEE